GAGDELQGIKKGVLELADAVTINKADGDNIQRAKEARTEYESALRLIKPSTPSWTPPVLTCSALAREGLEEIWNMVLDHREKLTGTGELSENRQTQALDWMWSLIHEGLAERFYNHPDIKLHLPAIAGDVETGNLAATAAASKLLFFLDKNR
ncbi:MAG: methylmalonyl Co-A mutase-associated GTPase MeaB, partial [Desulfobacterales bacterium]|nr:methylmalonyl Co-A mutase-associated GTPase MeaB [Desulfobacterales bacterium]